MKAKELMIDDWVFAYGKKTQIVWVGNIHKMAVRGFPYEFMDGEIEPIPLTPEILEKNGFYYGYTSDEEDIASNTIAQLSEDGKGWCWDEGGGAIKVIFPNVADGGLLVLDDQSFDRHLEMVFCETIYVHELQHVLRLCGIKKEIEL